LYYLSWAISAYNLKTGKQLYLKEFSLSNTSNNEGFYHAGGAVDKVFYKGKIYYTNGSSFRNGFRNINCIDAETGKLVWHDIYKYSESLGINPIIAHGKMYVPQFMGIRVYNPDNGKLIGVDTSFCGFGTGGRCLLYNDYMITARVNRDTGESQIVAVYVGE
jgi:outer membrane protein assembly factor BamB